MTSPDFLRQMVNYFIEDFQKNYLIVFSGERRTKAIKAISKACEIKIYGKPNWKKSSPNRLHTEKFVIILEFYLKNLRKKTIS